MGQKSEQITGLLVLWARVSIAHRSPEKGTGDAQNSGHSTTPPLGATSAFVYSLILKHFWSGKRLDIRLDVFGQDKGGDEMMLGSQVELQLHSARQLVAGTVHGYLFQGIRSIKKIFLHLQARSQIHCTAYSRAIPHFKTDVMVLVVIVHHCMFNLGSSNCHKFSFGTASDTDAKCIMFSEYCAFTWLTC